MIFSEKYLLFKKGPLSSIIFICQKVTTFPNDKCSKLITKSHRNCRTEFHYKHSMMREKIGRKELRREEKETKLIFLFIGP